MKKGFSYKTRRFGIIILSLLILLFFYFFRNADIPLRAISAVGFLILFYIVDHFFDIRFKNYHYFFAFIISFFGLLLSDFYFIYPQYDKILHFTLPFLVGSLIFYMVNKLELSFNWKLAFTFFILIAIIGLHEIVEYWLDVFFDFKLQGVYLRDVTGLNKFDVLQDRIDDTMIDMVMGLIGSGIYVIQKWFFNRK